MRSPEVIDSAASVRRPELAKLAETSVRNRPVFNMSHPVPTEKPANSENPRVFFDVDIGGERGQPIFIFILFNSFFLRSSFTIVVSIC